MCELRMSARFVAALVLIASVSAVTYAARKDPRPSGMPPAASTDTAADAYGRLPLSFERNLGQADTRVEFLARGKGYSLFLNRGAQAVIALGAVLKLNFAGGNPNARAEGASELPGKVNYLTGDRSRWRTAIPTYARVTYRGVYPGVDVVFYGNQRQVEYDLIVKPGADWRPIALDVTGADLLRVSDGGDLVAEIGGRELIQRKPVVYQEIDGQRHQVRGRYVLAGPSRVRFDVGRYDATHELFIDPVLVYSTFLDGTLGINASTLGESIAVDGSGVYIAATTSAADYPVTAGVPDGTANGNGDIVVTKLDPTGAMLIYSTYMGGSGNERAPAIAVDGSGSVYLVGTTRSSDLPLTAGSFDSTLNGGDDGFVAKLNAGGTALVYSTYLGGTGDDLALAVAVDTAGSAYVAGTTSSPGFPVTPGAFDQTLNGAADIFLAKVSSSGGALVFSTFVGGSVNDVAEAVAVDSAGNAYLAGYVDSTDFPTTPGAFDTTKTVLDRDATVLKLDASGASLIYSTFLGGSGSDLGFGIAVDASGAAYVAGATGSTDFPTTSGAFDTSPNGVDDVFVAKLNPAGSALSYATYLGGDSWDDARSIAVDPAGGAYVTGSTQSTSFPTTPGAFNTTGAFGQRTFVTKLNATGSSLAYSTYLTGDNGGGVGFGIAADGAGNAYVTGIAAFGFPTTPGAFDQTPNGSGSDAYVTKLAPNGGSLVFSTLIGGEVRADASASGVDIAADATGNVYVVGSTDARNFPTTAGAFQSTTGGDRDVFITKLDPSGTAAIYSTYLGGSSGDDAAGVAIDVSGNAYVTGSTRSADFPITPGAFDNTLNGFRDAFVAKLDSAGAALEYSTYLGGAGDDSGSAIAVDQVGSAYVTGMSADFPTTVGAFDRTTNGNFDAFVAKLEPNGSALAYSTYLGSSNLDTGSAIDVDASGAAYVTGYTVTTTGFMLIPFPATAGAFDTTRNGNDDVFVTKLNPSGATLAYSTYLGGSNRERGNGIDVDAGGAAYVTGSTSSVNFPTTAGALDTSGDGSEAFVTKLDTGGAVLGYSTYLGGGSQETGNDIAVDADGSVSVTGFTQSTNFPTTAGAVSTILGGSQDAFLSKLHPTGASLVYSTYLGGGGFSSDDGSSIALDAAGSAYVAGVTSASDFPSTPGAFDSTHNGGTDVFVSKIDFSTTFTLNVSLAGAGTGTVTSDDGLIDCPADCSEVYESGSTPVLTAVAAAGAVFTGWSGEDCTGTAPCPLTMDADEAVTATFAVSGRDLVIADVSTPAGPVSAGTSYAVMDTTRNQGAVLAGASTTRFYLSLDAVRSTGDKLLTGTRAVPGLETGVESSGVTTVTIPTTTAPGTYYQLACADDAKAIVEANEANNCTASAGTFVVALPDLIETTVTDPPVSIAPGGKWTVTDTVENQSAVGAGASTTRYYLSLDAVKSGGDVLLTGKRSVLTLAPGASAMGSASVTVPAGTGFATYRLLACADDLAKVGETNEGNNCIASAGSVVVGLPDLITTTVSNPPATVVAGGKFSVTDTVLNQGNVTAAASKTRYYLSLDAAWSAGDVLLTGTRNVALLQPTNTSSGPKAVTVPSTTPSNTYYVLACADDLKKVPESSEGNNCAASSTTIVVGP